MVKNFKPTMKGIDRMKANVTLVKKNREKKFNEVLIHEPNNRDHFKKIPDEFRDIKDFAIKSKTINKHKPEFFFDMKGDNKPLSIRKKSKLEKLKRPFTIINGKKFYQELNKL